MVKAEGSSTAVAHLLVRRSLRWLQQQELNTTSNANPTTTSTSTTINRLSLAAIILVPLLLFIILFMCIIVYCYYLPYLQYKDEKQQYHFKNDSNTSTLDHHSDGGNGSDSTEADDSLNDTNTQISQAIIEVDIEEVELEQYQQTVTTLGNTVSNASIAVVVTPSLNGMDHSNMTMLHRRPSYSQTLEETLLQYGSDATSDVHKINANDDDDDDDNKTTTTNGPICIDDGTSYDGNDNSDDDHDDDDSRDGGIIAKIRANAHSPTDEIMIFSDMENSSDDDGNDNDDDDAQSLSQRSYDNDPYGRYYKSYPVGATDHRLAATSSTGPTSTATSLLSLLNFESTQCDKKATASDHPTNIFKSLTLTKSTKATKEVSNTVESTISRPSLRRNCSMSSASSSVYDDIEEQAWIEFQQQSFDNGDTQAFPYQPQRSSSLSLPPSNNVLLLQHRNGVHIEDDDDYYSKRMDDVRSLDCKNICSNKSSTLVMQFDDLQRQRQLWDRIQSLPLSLSSITSSKKQQQQPSSPSTATATSIPITRQKVEL